MDELCGQCSPQDPHHVGGADDPSADANVAVLGQGVPLEYDLHAVTGTFLTGLNVDYGGVAFVQHDEVGTAGQSGGLSGEPEGVLANVPLASRGFPVVVTATWRVQE